MRSLPELRAIATDMQVPWTEDDRREDLQDKIRDALGNKDELQIDPMKAKDLKKDIAWGTDDEFAGLTKYFSARHVMEPKLDGARMRLFIGAGTNRMNTGRRSDVTHAYIERSDNFRHLRDLDLSDYTGTVLDGEILAPAASIDTGKTVTQGILNSSVALVNTNPDDSWACQLREGYAIFTAFDVIAWQGKDVTTEPLFSRRSMLDEISVALEHRAAVCHKYKCRTAHVIDQVPSTEAYIRRCLAAGLEGVMIKTQDGPYQAGRRSAHWMKVKRMSTIDVFITGFIPGEGRNEGKVGALKCGVYDENGLIIEIAQPGSFTDEFRDELSNPLDGSLRAEWSYKVIEVMAQEITKNMKLRHPQLVRVRPDKTAEECTSSQLDIFHTA